MPVLKSKELEAHCFSKLVKKLFDQSLQEDQTPKCDVVLIVGPESSKVEAHKFVLSLRSLVFNQMFKNKEIDEDEDEIEESNLELLEINKEALMNVLRYMYCDELPSGDKLNEIAVTYQVSDKYKVIGLCEKLLKLCESMLSIENALILYDQLLCIQSLVPAYKFIDLSEQALDIIKMHTFLVFKSSSFLQIRKETLVKLLDANFLFLKEIETFLAAVRWIAENCKTAEEQRNTLKSIKQLIRWPLMSKGQFKYAIDQSQKFFNKSGDQLFSSLELDEFAKYYEDEEPERTLSLTEYNDEPRRESLVVKIDYDREQECLRMYDPFADDSPNKFDSYSKLSDSVDSRAFTASMKKTFGKDYNKDCTLKKSKNANRVASKSVGKEDLYLFQVSCFVSEEDLVENNLTFEFYQNGIRKHDIKWQKYLKNGDGIFSFDPPLLVTLGKYYRLEFRTVQNVSFSLAFDVQQISRAEEESAIGKILDVKLISDNNITDQDLIGNLYFYYKQPY